jgi:hypothetical protein
MLRYVTGPGTTTELVMLQVILAAIYLANLHVGAHDEVGLGLSVQELRPRLLAKKKARPQQGNGTGLEEPLTWEWVSAATPQRENADAGRKVALQRRCGGDLSR